MRRSSGQVALSLNLVIAIFVVGSLGLVSYEMSRILLAREQLKHCLELAALGGGAELASTSQTGAAAQTTASAAAINILQMNSILGQPLTNSVIVSTSVAGLAPGPGQVSAYVEFDDPLTGQPGALGQANVLRVYGAYAYPLFSGGFGSIGVNVYTVMADATAGLPALDLVVVYNHDDSMDDQTPVSFVRRYWDPTLPAIAYLTPPPAGSENGILAPIICAPPIGTPVNGLPPQNLDAAGNPQNTTCGKQWSETGPTGTTSPLRGTLNMGAAPGDQPAALGGGGVGTVGLVAGRGYTQVEYAFQPPAVGPKRPGLWLQDLEARIENFHLFEQPAFAWFTAGPDYGSSAYNPWNADSTMFTDLVVNLDGNPTFGGYVDNGNQIGPNGQPMPGAGTFAAFAIPTMDFLVESSRGNMESNGNAPTIHEDNGIAAACQPGYKQAYQCCAYRQLQPKISVEESLQGFLTKISTTCDCHLGFVAFNDRAGMSPADSATAPAVSYAYPVAGNATYALPQIPLQLTGGGGGNPNQNPNLMAILNVLTPPTTNTQPLFVPNGGSNLAAGLQQAMANLTGPNSRQGAMKAIVVVTDKVPSRDLAGNIYSNPAANAPALADAMTFATAARAQGIPIFMVTVAQNPTEAGQMTQQFSDVTAGGLVNTAGSGGTLYVENWTTPAGTYGALTGDFNNVIRQLMTLVQGAVQGP